MNLRLFREQNNLLAKDVAIYLGISAGRISQFESGICSVPPRHLSRLLNNDRGWKTDALLKKSEEEGGCRESCEVIRLRAENAMLREQIRWMQDTIDRLTRR